MISWLINDSLTIKNCLLVKDINFVKKITCANMINISAQWSSLQIEEIWIFLLKIHYNLNLNDITFPILVIIILFYIKGAGIHLLHSKDAVKTCSITWKDRIHICRFFYWLIYIYSSEFYFPSIPSRMINLSN